MRIKTTLASALKATLVSVLALNFSTSWASKQDEIRITGQYKVPAGPEWINNAVFYQIYPQTFYDTDGDGIGDLQGIIAKLDYVKSLGVDGIWINPFFASPFHDAGYDISDYYKVAPRYGNNEDAKRLFKEAHKRGLKVLFDYVASYTAIDNPWFEASARQDNNKYSNWYIWNDNTWIDPPAEFRNNFIKGYSQRNGQFMFNFYWNEPALNYGFAKPTEKWMKSIDDPDVLALRKEMKNVVRFWMDMGADGFRADMAGALVKTANVQGNEQFFNSHEDGTVTFWKEVRAMLDKDYPGAFTVAEWSDPKAAIPAGFTADFFHWNQGFSDLFQKESWRILNGHSDGHSFFDKQGKGDVTEFLRTYMPQLKSVEGQGYVSIPLGNHDLSRLNIQRSDDELEMIFAFDLSLPGIPFIYYGNEIGMRQLDDPPYVEGAYKPRSGARTPMQWSKEKNLGFSTTDTSKLYLPVDSAGDAPVVTTQEKDPQSLLNRVRKLIALKKQEPALKAYAEFVPVYAKQNEYPFVFARAAGKEVILAVFNPADRAANAEFSLNIAAKKLKQIAGNKVAVKNSQHDYKVTAAPISYALYKVTP
ncbi:MAG TPA: alpha-amylase family glycosyl hydrolase [Steroidobacteraceae bacterium]|nr:alpha-amylase family glycosyl hydrolase [Steroidobacteraceae bacterium]